MHYPLLYQYTTHWLLFYQVTFICHCWFYIFYNEAVDVQIWALLTRSRWRFSKEVFHHSKWKLDWWATSFNLLGIHFTTDLENIVDINYNLQLPKIKALIKQWKRRILTPIGRITVVKTLIIPKLNHLFISIPTPKKMSYLHWTKIFLNIYGNLDLTKLNAHL